MPTNRFTLYPHLSNKKIYPKGSIIYKIINVVNDKVYIGQTINFCDRLKWHRNKLKNNSHSSLKLQRSYNKYGIDNFYIEIIETPIFEKLEEREEYWIGFFKAYDATFGFNSNAKSKPFYGKRTPEQIKNMSNGQKGIYPSKETRQRQSEARIGRFKGKDNPKSRAIDQYDLNMNYINSYDTITEASLKTGIYRTAINQNYLGKSKMSGGFIWKYKNQAA